MAMAVMRARIKSQGACLSLGMRWRCSLQWPSTESLSAAHEFSRGVPGRKDRNGAPASSQRWLHAGVALRARAAREDNNAEDRLHLEEVVAEAKRVVDNGTLKDMQVVMRRVQLVDPAGKWKVWVNKPELEKQLRKFVAEAKAAKTALEEDLLLVRQQRKTGQRQVESAQRQVESAQRQVESAQRQVESAQRQVESAQRQVESAQEQEAMAVRRLARAATVLETAEDSGNATKVQEAKKEVQEAKKEVQEAKKEVQEAKKEVQEAERKVQEAKKEEAKASGRTKESEARSSWCEKLLAKKLKFGAADQLLATVGATWDYCGKEVLRESMQIPIQKLHEQKGKNSDKQLHPLFIAFAGPGQGKSRLLTEFPGLVEQCLQNVSERQKLKFSKQTTSFMISCENGLSSGDWATEELNARRFVACRMLWQLRNANKEAFREVGAPTDFAEFRIQCPADLTPSPVLKSVLRDELNHSTVVIGVDGMQGLPGFTERSDAAGKDLPFYQVMQEVCRLINQIEGPFVVACVAALQNVKSGLAGSPQARVFLELPRVTAVTRNKQPVLPGHRLKDLLVEDMGGHGRALECLLEALMEMPNAAATALVGAVMRQLRQKYPDATQIEPGADLKELLRAALSGRWILSGEMVGNLDPEKVELIRVKFKDGDSSQYRIDLPYIWLYLMLSLSKFSDDLQPWNLMDYRLFESEPTWQQWEEFNARFRVLRASAFEDGQLVDIADLHRGAVIQPDSLKSTKVINRHLQFAKSRKQLLSRSSCCGNPKARTNLLKGLGMHQCVGVLVVNAAGAPAADAFLMLEEVRAEGNNHTISECLQCKKGNSPFIVENERDKACDTADILVLLLTRTETVPQTGGQRLIFVSEAQYQEYFGFYAGRAFYQTRAAKP
ncbi:unnamed protein product [Effrenium voratum]|uniref:Uncharacterized protein n=1 Tax=Effrenium voratum TaxID=2562239 RepID=A0AA36ID95_9DINO|nr:unnamed protein product [Effrenium voratum]